MAIALSLPFRAVDLVVAGQGSDEPTEFDFGDAE